MNVNKVCPIAATCRIKGCSMCVSSQGEMSECEHYRSACKRLDNARFVGFLTGVAFFLLVQFVIAIANRVNRDSMSICPDAVAGTPPCEMRSGD